MNYHNVFLIKYIQKLLKYINKNNYIIKLKKAKYLLFKLIYSLKLVKLETLKIYIKINWINRLIKSFKSFAKIINLFS